MQSTKQLPLRRNTEMDLPRTQLSLLVGYAKARFEAALRTLAGGRRDKSPVRSSKGRRCPSGSTFTESSKPILLLWQVPRSRNSTGRYCCTVTAGLLRTCTGRYNCLVTDTHLFMAVDAESFQEVIFNFLMSITMNLNSAGLQHSLYLHRWFLFWNCARFDSFSASRSTKFTAASMPHCCTALPWENHHHRL